MKLTISDLERVQKESVVSTGKIQVATPERPFQAGQVNFRNASGMDVYPVDELNRVVAMGWDLIKHLNEALRLRATGKKVLSFREADIAARSKMDLIDNSSLEYALLKMDCLLTEGVPGHDESGYELRRRYNNGLKWMKIREKEGFLPGMREKGIERLSEIRSKLLAIGLDLWGHEVDTGFHADLLRPEWMSHTEYNKCRRWPVTIVEVEPSVDAPG